MLDHKKKLLKDRITSDAEHAMVAKSHGRADSPQQLQRTAKPRPVKRASQGASARGSKR